MIGTKPASKDCVRGTHSFGGGVGVGVLEVWARRIICM